MAIPEAKTPTPIPEARIGFRYFPHDADMGVVGEGLSLEQAMEQAAGGLFSLMSEPAGVRPAVRVDVAFDEDDAELAQSMRGVAEEAPGAYKDADVVAE